MWSPKIKHHSWDKFCEIRGMCWYLKIQNIHVDKKAAILFSSKKVQPKNYVVI
jgi:hypothetical protein